MAAQPASPEHLLTPAEVAAIVFVDPKTVSRWARAGKIPFTSTPGGHRRFRSSDVEALMRADHVPQQRQALPRSPIPDGATVPRGGAQARRDVARVAADAMVAEAVAIALEAQADAATEVVVERAEAVVVAAATAAAAVAKARHARAVATAEADLAQEMAGRDSVESHPTSILGGVAR